jgi:hypothetical protein
LGGVILEQKKSKQLTIFLLSLFVAVIFVTSYAAFNNSAYFGTTATTTVQGGQTYFVTGVTNGIVSGYGTSAQIIITGNGTASTEVGNILQQMQINGSITEYFPYGSGYDAFLNTINPYALQQLLVTMAPPNTITINATSVVTLPNTIQLYYSTQAIKVMVPSRNYTLTIMPLQSIGSNVPLSVRALVTASGSIYNNQISVSQKR